MNSNNQRFKCLCCENYTLDHMTGNTFQLCPVCYWEDDGIQSNDSEYPGGANSISLSEARINYKQFGACEKRFIRYVIKML